MALSISRAQLSAILAEARAAGARECCGLLLGTDLRVETVRPARNVAADPVHRFEIDPAVLLAAHRAARTGGPDVIGHYHSHPSGPAEPSATDAAMAARTGEVWILVGADGVATGWRAQDAGGLHGCFEPLALILRDDHGLAPQDAQAH